MAGNYYYTSSTGKQFVVSASSQSQANAIAQSSQPGSTAGVKSQSKAVPINQVSSPSSSYSGGTTYSGTTTGGTTSGNTSSGTTGSKQVTVLINGKPVTVNEVRPGLLGELGYTYVNGSGDIIPSVDYEQSMPENALNAMGDTFNTAQSTSDMLQALMKQANDYQKQMEQARTEQRSWLEKLTAPPEQTMEQKMKAMEESLGIKASTDSLNQQMYKIQSLQNDINKLETDRQTEIDRTYNRLAPMANIRSEVGEINRLYDSQKAYKSVALASEVALAQLYQGQVDSARDSIDRAITAWTYDQEEQVKRYEYLYNYHTDWINSLSNDYKNTLDRAYQLSLYQLEQAKNDAAQKRDLWMDAAQRGVSMDYNKMLNMTLDEATGYYNQRVAEKTGAETIGGGISEEDESIIEAYANMVLDGVLPLSSVPAEYRNQVTVRLNQPQQQKSLTDWFGTSGYLGNVTEIATAPKNVKGSTTTEENEIDKLLKKYGF